MPTPCVLQILIAHIFPYSVQLFLQALSLLVSFFVVVLQLSCLPLWLPCTRVQFSLLFEEYLTLVN